MAAGGPGWSWAEDAQLRYRLTAVCSAACKAGNEALVSCCLCGLGYRGQHHDLEMLAQGYAQGNAMKRPGKAQGHRWRDGAGGSKDRHG